MVVGLGCGRTRGVLFLAAALFWAACSNDKPIVVRGEDPVRGDDDDKAADAEDGDDSAPVTSKDSGVVKEDGGKKPTGPADAGTKPSEDASVDKPDAKTGSAAAQDGGASAASKDGGAGTGDASTSTGAPCPLIRYPLANGQAATDFSDFPVQQVNGGVSVNGVGCEQQWEGIVMTVGGRGLCTAAFISDRHLISASHCYANDGAVSLKVSAPTWDNGMSHTFQAQVKRSGSNMSLDISVIDLGQSVPWATPERRYVLHAGKAAAVDLHLYGFGDSSSSGGAGKLRGVPNRATIRVTDDGKGNLSGKAGKAQLCTGDSGGPAFAEKTAPVLYGINQAIVPAGFGGSGTCASTDWTIMFTNVSAYLPFVEKTIGKPCERKKVDDLDVAQCW